MSGTYLVHVLQNIFCERVRVTLQRSGDNYSTICDPLWEKVRRKYRFSAMRVYSKKLDGFGKYTLLHR